MSTPRSPFQKYAIFKVVILLLLAIDAAIYTVGDVPSAALDAIAWLTLLLLFEWETVLKGRWRGNWLTAAIHAARIAAIVGIGLAAIAFFEEHAWLDAMNTALWIGVVAMLELEVRFPQWVARWPRLFFALSLLLYGALALLVLAWAWHGEWLDAYDALIWIIAFAIIEMDVLRFSRNSASERASAPSESAAPQ
ncbi:MAG: hypothetical protein MUF20_09660 [Methylotetracoccus sp.]|nr:hypothetical protein [Methylotetracoccus sp.]